MLIGGYLVLNGLGRPLEFHCTEPVKPNRAQEILYGPTLRGFLCGEQIGQALFQHAQSTPELVLTDTEAMLTLRDFTEVPILGVSTGDSVVVGRHILSFCLGSNQVYVSQRRVADQERVEQVYREQIPDWDLREPFQRISEAIRELQKAA